MVGADTGGPGGGPGCVLHAWTVELSKTRPLEHLDAAVVWCTISNR